VVTADFGEIPAGRAIWRARFAACCRPVVRRAGRKDGDAKPRPSSGNLRKIRRRQFRRPTGSSPAHGDVARKCVLAPDICWQWTKPVLETRARGLTAKIGMPKCRSGRQAQATGAGGCPRVPASAASPALGSQCLGCRAVASIMGGAHSLAPKAPPPAGRSIY